LLAFIEGKAGIDESARVVEHLSHCDDCLSAVGAFAPLSVNDLAQQANLNKGQASRAAQALVDQGLVRKEASTTD
jgi:DNA-binding IclR family transcriptional regulator